MHAPIRHQTARVIPKPAEIKMEAVFVKGLFWSRSKPHVIVHPRRSGTVGLNGHGFHPSLVGPALHQTNLSQLAGFDIIDGIGVLGAASLPLAYLYNLAISFGGLDHDVAFFNGICQWLFHIDVLAGREAIHEVQAVPM